MPLIDPKIERLQSLFMYGRLPKRYRDVLDLASSDMAWTIAAALSFVDLGIHSTIPCLARGHNGNWFAILHSDKPQ